MPYKLGILKGKDFEPFKYGNIYWIEETPGYRRLCIGSNDPWRLFSSWQRPSRGLLYSIHPQHP
jgi:hypothetical protein